MKYLTFLLTLTPVIIASTLYEQPYEYANLAYGMYMEGPEWILADNFTLTEEATVQSITIWLVNTGSGHPYDVALRILENDGGNLGTEVWSETVPASYQTETLTGDQQWGYDLYKNDFQLQNYPTLPAGEYWLSSSVLGAPAPVAWLCCAPTYPPTMWQYWSGSGGVWNTINCDGWFGLYDSDVSLARASWGSIKTAF